MALSFGIPQRAKAPGPHFQARRDPLRGHSSGHKGIYFSSPPHLGTTWQWLRFHPTGLSATAQQHIWPSGVVSFAQRVTHHNFPWIWDQVLPFLEPRDNLPSHGREVRCMGVCSDETRNLPVNAFLGFTYELRKHEELSIIATQPPFYLRAKRRK